MRSLIRSDQGVWRAELGACLKEVSAAVPAMLDDLSPTGPMPSTLSPTEHTFNTLALLGASGSYITTADHFHSREHLLLTFASTSPPASL